MSSIGSLIAPAAASTLTQSLALARAANPRNASIGPFDQHLDIALRKRVDAADAGGRFGISGDVTSIEALRAEHETALAEFEMRFRRLLREQGVDLGAGIVLEADAQGNVQVVGDHPQKPAIERLFQNDAELRNLFVQLDARASLLRAADQAAELARLQSESPTDAAAQVQQLLGVPSTAKFSLAVRANELAAQFT